MGEMIAILKLPVHNHILCDAEKTEFKKFAAISDLKSHVILFNFCKHVVVSECKMLLF